MNFGAIGYARSFNDLPVMPYLAFEAKLEHCYRPSGTDPF
jgi:hypothetical protein